MSIWIWLLIGEWAALGTWWLVGWARDRRVILRAGSWQAPISAASPTVTQGGLLIELAGVTPGDDRPEPAGTVLFVPSEQEYFVVVDGRAHRVG